MATFKSSSRLCLAALAALLLLAVATGCLARPVFEAGLPPRAKPRAALRQVSFQIQKLSCASCAKTIAAELAAIPGVRYVRIELHLPWDADGLVVYDSSEVATGKLSSVVRSHRYYETSVQDRIYRQAPVNPGVR